MNRSENRVRKRWLHLEGHALISILLPLDPKQLTSFPVKLRLQHLHCKANMWEIQNNVFNECFRHEKIIKIHTAFLSFGPAIK